MNLVDAMAISASGMRTQGTRLRIVSENIANAQSTAREPGGEPYRRKTVTFANEFDRARGVDLVTVDRIARDLGEFERAHDPTHPAADAEGYVLMPNVQVLVEMMDMREAQRSYEANIRSMTTARTMLMNTVDLLRG